MLNTQKVELNTRLLVYEQGKGREALKLRSDNEGKGIVRSRMTTVICGIICYLCILVLAYAAGIGSLISFSDRLLLTVGIILAAAIIGILFVWAYVKIITRADRKSYRNIRSSLSKYDVLKKNTQIADK